MKFLEGYEEIGFNSSSLVYFAITVICILWIVLNKVLNRKSRVKKPPGPTGIPFFGYVLFLGKKPWVTFLKLKKKYGDIFGLYLGSKYTVILNEFKLAKEVLNHPAALSRGENILDAPIHFGVGGLSGKPWQEQRRFVFSTARDLGLGKDHWEELVMEEAGEFVGKLRSKGGKPTDIGPQISTSTVKTILSLLLGRRLNAPEDVAKVALATEYNDMSLLFLGVSHLPSVVPCLQKVYEVLGIDRTGDYLKLTKRFLAFLRDEINKHKTTSLYKDNHDFINSYLEKIEEMEKSKSEHSFTEYMLEGNLNSLLLGASDTTTSSLNWIFRLMAKHQHVQEKIYKELMENVGKEGRARYEDRDKFPYTFATILEAQRVSSISPFTITRWVNDDIHVNGYVIPKGSEVFANSWALHHDPQYWERPEEFRPEHFLTTDGTLNNQAPGFLAFSIGKRKCPGEHVAYRHILTFLSEVVKHFKIETPPGVEASFDVITAIITRLEPQLLCFKERRS